MYLQSILERETITYDVTRVGLPPPRPFEPQNIILYYRSGHTYIQGKLH